MSQPITRRHARRPLALVSAAVFLAAARPACGIPTNPDPCHTVPCTPWASVAFPINPATNRHQHRNADPLDGVNAKFKTYSVWDDRAYRYNGIGDARLADFGHGFMANAARYRFDFTVPAWAQTEIRDKVIAYWDGVINEVGGTNTNGDTTDTRIGFTETNVVGQEDILIYFSLGAYPITANQNGTFPTPSEIDSVGDWPGRPNVPGGAPKGGRSNVLAFWSPSLRVLSFNGNINWYQSDPVNPANDTDPTVQPDRFDFVTTALHEWGHVLGLDHPDNETTPNTMFSKQGRRGYAGSQGAATTIMRTLDGDTRNGGKILYTIAYPPVPATPTTWGRIKALYR